MLGGYYLSRPLFRFVAQLGLREVFTAAALMLVIGIAALMSLPGLSPALGTFLAGVVLANSEFRHELETNIEPFKGLLLGLFFITVGAGIDFQVLAQDWALVATIVAAVILIKASIVYLLARIFGIGSSDRWLVTLGARTGGRIRLRPAELQPAKQRHPGQYRPTAGVGGRDIDVPDPCPVHFLR